MRWMRISNRTAGASSANGSHHPFWRGRFVFLTGADFAPRCAAVRGASVTERDDVVADIRIFLCERGWVGRPAAALSAAAG
jgi:hypothetical protein